ncbi:MAG: exodeoxyribonuclease III [Chloroflexi bacterium]|nr:exodeoxyribonuclease III [Chloroflexota bacterium]
MKIASWNVNGYRAAYAKGLLRWTLEQGPDVLCLQEIKARPDQLSADQLGFPGYHAFWNPAEKAGYSGVASFYKSEPDEVIYGLGEPRFDVEGRVIRSLHPGFNLYNIYFPNGQRGHDRVSYKLDFYETLLRLCDQMHAGSENIIITGDFNTAHEEIDLANPKENSTTSGFLPEERVWIDYFLQHGFVDAYRWLYPDRIQYTWWTYRFGARKRNIGWRIDYFLVSQALIDRVCDVVIHTDVEGSDHCPVVLEIQ